ncbi:MAG: SWIM zinc finger family protein [Gammaproteobacteria bacterium]|nr:SWIM zinc finger family protein [Gammaproteobacteria bacterium]
MKTAKQVKSINTIVEKLTFDDLQAWAGETILNRGKGYVKRINQLSRIEDNTLAAWVIGSERYATSVRIGDAGDFEYFCSCPYSWGPCKHAVAVILAAAEQVKRKEIIPVLDEDQDLREALFGDSEEDGWIDDEWEDDKVAHSSTPQRTKTQEKFGKMLANKSREELLDLLVDLSSQFPEVRQHIVEKEQLASGEVDKLLRALRSEILPPSPLGTTTGVAKAACQISLTSNSNCGHWWTGITLMQCCSLAQNSGPGVMSRSNSPMTREKPPWPLHLAWKTC